MENIIINKQVFEKTQFLNTVNNNFTQLTSSQATPTGPAMVEATVDGFFTLYEDLFFDIPKLGDLNSHQYLITTSGNYVGGTTVNDSIQILLDEIANLRTALLDANRTITDLQIQAGIAQQGINPNLFLSNG
jgi:hypothetical protein